MSRSSIIKRARKRLLHLDLVRLVQALGVPTDLRGAAQAVGFLGLAALGLVGVINGDPLGYAYLVGALTGYLFLQTQLVPVTLWLMLAGGGAWGVIAGGPAGWVQIGIGAFMGGLAAFPTVEEPFFAVPGSGPTWIAAGLEPHVKLSRTSGFHEEPGNQAAISIESIGRLRVIAAGVDLTSSIIDKRTLGFLWCLLFSVALRNPEGALSRAELAAELGLGLTRRSQRDRLRRQVWDLQHDLPAPLGDLVSTERSQIRFNLGPVACDVVQLRDLAETLCQSGLAVTPDLHAHVRSVIELSAGGSFLPEFEDLALSAHQSRATAKHIVADVRAQVVHALGELARFLAQHPTPMAGPQANRKDVNDRRPPRDR